MVDQAEGEGTGVPGLDAGAQGQEAQRDPELEEALNYARASERERDRERADHQARGEQREQEATQRKNRERQREQEESLRKTREEQQRQGQQGRGVMGRIGGALGKFLMFPFAILLNGARRLIGRVTGKDLVNRVKESKSALNDLNDEHERTEDKFSSKMRSLQNDISEMHLAQSQMLDDLVNQRRAAAEGVTNAAQGAAPSEPGSTQPGSSVGLGQPATERQPATEGQQADQEPDQKPADQPREGVYEAGGESGRDGEGKAKSGTVYDGDEAGKKINPADRERHQENTNEGTFTTLTALVMQSIPEAAMPKSLVTRESWAQWRQEGASPEEVRDAMLQERGDEWTSALSKAQEVGVKNMSKDERGRYFSAMVEMHCAANSDDLLEASGSVEGFERQMMTQAGIATSAIASVAESEVAGLDRFMQVAQGDWDAAPHGWQDHHHQASNMVYASYSELKENYDAWVGKANPDIDIAVEPAGASRSSKPQVLDLPGGTYSDTVPDEPQDGNRHNGPVQAAPGADRDREHPQNDFEETASNDEPGQQQGGDRDPYDDDGLGVSSPGL